MIRGRFSGSRSRYLAAIRNANMSLTTARGVIADEIRRARIEARLGGGHPSADDIADFKATYADAKARLVQTSVRVPWLGGQTKGYALEPNAPLIVSGLPALTWTDVWSPAGSVRVQPLGPVRSLRSLPLSSVRASIRPGGPLSGLAGRQDGLLVRPGGVLAGRLSRRRHRRPHRLPAVPQPLVVAHEVADLALAQSKEAQRPLRPRKAFVEIAQQAVDRRGQCR